MLQSSFKSADNGATPFAQGKANFRFFTGMQLLTLVALLGMDGDPLDVMLRQHGVLDRAYLDMNDAIFHRPDGNVFFYGGIGGIGDDFGHLFPAAHDRNAAILYLGNDIAAVFANIKFLFHRGSSCSNR